MENIFSFDSTDWHNIENLSNFSTENDIFFEKSNELKIEKPFCENQNIEKTALLFRKSIIDFYKTFKNRDEKKQIQLYESNEAESIKKIFNQALKKYKSLGFDKIAPLDELQELQVSFTVEEWLESREYFAKQDLRKVEFFLKNANNSILNPSERAPYIPQMTGAMTANGTYYVYGGKNLDQSPSKIERLFIAKPAMQEAGAPNNPQKNPQMSDGIKGGGGAIRERIVYAGQSLLKMDCGIPPTFITQVKNSFLSSEVDFDKITNCLEIIKKVDKNLDLGKFIEFIKKRHSLNDILISIRSQNIPDSSPLEKTVFEIISAKKIEGIPATYPVILKELRKKYPISEIQSSASLLKEALEKHNALESLEESIRTLWNEIFLSTEKQSIVSFQQYVPDCQSLGWWLQRYDQNDLSVEEVHKLIIDLIFFNTDRHMSNVLVRMNTSIPKIVLIDHGSCLPHPLGEEDCKGLKQARYEFLELPHCNEPLHSKYAQIINNLDIDRYIECLKKDQLDHELKFGEACNIPDECYQLIQLNLHLIQVGIEIGATVKEMGFMHQITQHGENLKEGELIDIYSKHVYKNEPIDWIRVRNELKSILINKRK